MRMNIILACMLLTIGLTARSVSSQAIEYYAGSVAEAKEKAAQEGKLVFVDFYAKWCAPCKWMDEMTFSNEDVAQVLNERYISVKVDIDEFDGYALKQQYEIRYLPTMLVFDEKGELIDRLEETLSPLKMKSTLLALLESKGTSKAFVNASPKQISKKSESNSYTVGNENQMYRVQVGSFSDFKNTFSYVNDLKELFLEPVIVLNDYVGDRIVYRVMLGEFQSKSEASSFVGILEKDFQIKGIVK